VGETHTLRARRHDNGRNHRRLHYFDTSTIRETEKAGSKTLHGIHVIGANDSAKIASIELLAPFQILRP
jgi:hypothetical protein